MLTRVKTDSEIAIMRDSGRMLATVLSKLKSEVVPGISTKELSNIAKRELGKLGGKPTFLNYQGFPDIICISVNDEVVHGIPKSNKILESGDIVGLDFGVTYKGMVTDSAISVIVDKPVNERDSQLLEVTYRAMMAGINSLHDNIRTGDIGSAIEAVLKKYGFGVVRDLVGHGVGHEMHEDPNIPNYGRRDSGPWLKSGMTIAIEPMATLGSEQVFVANDNWTILTRDGSRSAHFEHSVLIKEDGAEILTTL